MTQILAEDLDPVDIEGNGWRHYAACKGENPDLWYGTVDNNHTGNQRAARIICMSCPVRAACLEFSLRTKEPYGMWGGVTERERDRLLGRQTRKYRYTPRKDKTV